MGYLASKMTLSMGKIRQRVARWTPLAICGNYTVALATLIGRPSSKNGIFFHQIGRGLRRRPAGACGAGEDLPGLLSARQIENLVLQITPKLSCL